jgi:predicted phage terminase large subunit-like protein
MDFSRLIEARPLVAEQLQKDLGAFCRAAWPTLHPGSKLRWNWHMDLLAEYLTLVRRGQIRRLIVNVPPRTAKTTEASICFPVWWWLSEPEKSFLCASYELDLAGSHNLKRRQLITSGWFQSLFADRFKLSSDRSLVEEFTNASGGAMLAASVNSRAMGRGGDCIVVDDPLSADAAYSDILRSEVNEWFMHMMPQRLNDPSTSPIILIAQRLHENDPCGFLLEREPGEWTHVKLPLVAEEDERWVFPISGRVVVRRKDEVLDPARFSKKVVEARKRNRIVFSGQYQQRPAPLEGNIVRVADIMFYGGKDPRTGQRDPELPAHFDQKIISVDCAFKDKSTSDYVAVLTIGILGSRRYLINIVNAHLDLDATESEIRRQHALFAPVSAVLVEDAANGASVITHLKENISGVIAVNPQGGKMARMVAASPEFQAHDWYVDRNGAWTDKFIEQVTMFPHARHDDISDATSQASIWLQANTHELGLVAWWKRKAAEIAAGIRNPDGTRKVAAPGPVPQVESGKPVQAHVDGRVKWVEKPTKCEVCGIVAVGPHSDGHGKTLCRQCGAVNGVPPPKPIIDNICPVPDCGLKMVWSGGILRCQNHGQPPATGEAPRGMTFAQLKSRRGRFG